MASVIDINHRLNGPEPDCVWTDPDGAQWFKYSIQYPYQGKFYCCDIMATSLEDAYARLDAIQSRAVIMGQVLAEIAP